MFAWEVPTPMQGVRKPLPMAATSVSEGRVSQLYLGTAKDARKVHMMLVMPFVALGCTGIMLVLHPRRQKCRFCVFRHF